MRSILERELATCNTRGGAELADLNSISDDEIKYLQRAANYPDAPRNLIHDALFPTRKKPWLTMWPRIIEFSGPKAGVIMIMSIMPVALLNYIFTVQNDKDANSVGSLVMISTSLMLIFLPAIIKFVLIYF